MDIGFLIHLVGGIGIGVAAVWLTLQGARSLRRGDVRSVGKVVDFQPRNTDEGLMYAPIVAFVDGSGAKREFTDEFASPGPMHHVGELVPVTYPPERPGDARVNSARHNVWTIALPLAMGAVFLVISLVLLVPIARDHLQ